MLYQIFTGYSTSEIWLGRQRGLYASTTELQAGRMGNIVEANELDTVTSQDVESVSNGNGQDSPHSEEEIMGDIEYDERVICRCCGGTTAGKSNLCRECGPEDHVASHEEQTPASLRAEERNEDANGRAVSLPYTATAPPTSPEQAEELEEELNTDARGTDPGEIPDETAPDAEPGETVAEQIDAAGDDTEELDADREAGQEAGTIPLDVEVSGQQDETEPAGPIGELTPNEERETEGPDDGTGR